MQRNNCSHHVLPPHLDSCTIIISDKKQDDVNKISILFVYSPSEMLPRYSRDIADVMQPGSASSEACSGQIRSFLGGCFAKITSVKELQKQ
jgi:hypothetical protein